MAKFHEVDPNYMAWHCPGCEGGHAVPTKGFYPDQPERGWGWNRSLEAPTLTPSILVHPHDASPPFKPQPLCHSYITDGRIQFLADCTHKLAGQTVDVPEWE